MGGPDPGPRKDQGTPEKDVQLDTAYVMEFEGDSIAGTSHNIKNFETGAAVSGERIDGLLMFEKKLKPTDSFMLKGANTSVAFRFSEIALRMLGK